MAKKKKSSMLREAIKDINKELSALGKEKSSFKKQIGSLDTGLEGAQLMEKQLQGKIARMIEKEASLNKRKKDTQEDIDRLEEKLSKVKKIKNEMTDL